MLWWQHNSDVKCIDKRFAPLLLALCHFFLIINWVSNFSRSFIVCGGGHQNTSIISKSKNQVQTLTFRDTLLNEIEQFSTAIVPSITTMYCNFGTTALKHWCIFNKG